MDRRSNQVRFPAFPPQYTGQQPVLIRPMAATDTAQLGTSAHGKNVTATHESSDIQGKQLLETTTTNPVSGTERTSLGTIPDSDKASKTAVPRSSSIYMKDLEKQLLSKCDINHDNRHWRNSSPNKQCRKRHINDNQNHKTEILPDQGKRHCEKLEITVCRNTSEMDIESSLADNFYSLDLTDDPLYTDSTPQKNSTSYDKNCDNQNNKMKPFLEIPAIKHNPPEPIQDSQLHEQRE